jgi:hypothetical protein
MLRYRLIVIGLPVLTLLNGCESHPVPTTGSAGVCMTASSNQNSASNTSPERRREIQKKHLL